MISPIQNCPAAHDYINRIGAKWKTLYTAAIEQESMGYMREIVSIRFTERGEVTAPDGYQPTPEEEAAIAEQVSRIEFPHQMVLAAIPNSKMSKMMLEARDEDLFIFKNRKGEIEFVQVRIDLPNGDKRYVPQTYWSDGIWRAMEPDAGLPIYGLENVHKGDRVFLHEGAKAARAAQRVAEDVTHPFYRYFSTGKHIGWVGGAHYVGKTRWDELTPLPGELVIVPDNDYVGRAKVNKISRKFECGCLAAIFDNSWPPGWDCADPLPQHLYSDQGLYIGPEFEDLLAPCDAATEQVGLTDNGKPIYDIRDRFASKWVRVQKLKHYVHADNPENSMDKEQFNVMVRPYSHVADTAAMLAKNPGNICEQLTFLPEKPTGLIYHEGELQFNQYRDRRIKPKKGDTKPFHDFMAYMFADEEERHHVMRWIATHYARPDIKMSFAILMLSKVQGVGKSTLMNILAYMTGIKHTSFPGDAMIQSEFNEWLINRRLVVVHEIYAGQNWKAYNRLKSLVTDENIGANAKHMSTYTFPNRVHFIAASNSMEALRMEHDDRRWFVPNLPEHLYDKYDELYQWMARGGLNHLAFEFKGWNDLVQPGERAPQTSAKKRLIDQSMPLDERMVVTLCDRMMEGQTMDVQDIWIWMQAECRGRAFASPQRIVTLLKERGYHVDEPLPLGNRTRQLVWRNPDDKESQLNGTPSAQASQTLMGLIQMPSDVFAEKEAM